MAFNETKQGSEERLCHVKEKAPAFETEIKTIKAVVNRYTRNNSFHGRAAIASALQPMDLFEDPTSMDLTYLLIDLDDLEDLHPSDQLHLSSVLAGTPIVSVPDAPPLDIADRCILQCTICSSMAE